MSEITEALKERLAADVASGTVSGDRGQQLGSAAGQLRVGLERAPHEHIAQPARSQP